MQKSIRFPDELAVRVQQQAVRSDRSFSWVVLRAVEVALGAPDRRSYERALEKALGSAGAVATAEPDRGSSASSRASEVVEGMERPSQREFQERVRVPGLVPASSLVKQGVKPIPKRGGK